MVRNRYYKCRGTVDRRFLRPLHDKLYNTVPDWTVLYPVEAFLPFDQVLLSSSIDKTPVMRPQALIRGHGQIEGWDR